MPMTRNELFIGGARSGKSALAERRAQEAADRDRLRVIYIATCEARDAEMARRIAHHRARRSADWGLVEAPVFLAETLRVHAAADCCLLIDCLTLWLSNVMFAGQAARQAAANEVIDCPLLTNEMQALVDLVPTLPGRVLIVSNEVGWGIVPGDPVSRCFADEQGRLNQRLAAVCDRVTLVAAGLPLALK